MPSAIEVRKVPIHSVADASELTKLVDDGVIAALDNLAAAVAGHAGTRVVPSNPSTS